MISGARERGRPVWAAGYAATYPLRFAPYLRHRAGFPRSWSSGRRLRRRGPGRCSPSPPRCTSWSTCGPCGCRRPTAPRGRAGVGAGAGARRGGPHHADDPLAAGPDRGGRRWRSSCSTTGPPTAPPTTVRAAAAGDPRLAVLTGSPPPAGWLGKPHACAQLAAAARGRVLVFVDADVVLAPHAVAAAVELLRGARAATCSARGRGSSPTGSGRGWCSRCWRGRGWCCCRCAGRSARRARRWWRPTASSCWSTPRRWRRPAGSPACPGEVLDDIALARAMQAVRRPRRCRRRIADRGRAACTRAGRGQRGYRKSLWAAFGSRRPRRPPARRCSRWPTSCRRSRRCPAPGPGWSATPPARRPG